jgi:hypothetical protein
LAYLDGDGDHCRHGHPVHHGFHPDSHHLVAVLVLVLRLLEPVFVRLP